MSEFHCEVVRLVGIEKHPNADSLSVTVTNGYPVTFRTGDYAEGDLAVYVPVDAIVPEGDPRWEFLGGHRRIKAKRLRGLFSCGLLTKADPGWVEGQNVQAELRIEKYDPERALETKGSKTYGGDQESPTGVMGQVPTYDLEGLRKFSGLLAPGEEVVLTEKIHGASSRFVFDDGQLRVGSRNRWLKPEYEKDKYLVFGGDGTIENGDVMVRERVTVQNDSVWWQVARKYGLAEKLQAWPGLTLFGEVYGAGVQDLDYGVTRSEGCRLAIFDAMDTRTHEFYSHDELFALMVEMGLPMAPMLYRGPWSDSLRSYAEGRTTMPGASHVREGFVVRPVRERVDLRHGRVVLKLPGEGYLTRKEVA